jgi:hypothetical protein
MCATIHASAHQQHMPNCINLMQQNNHTSNARIRWNMLLMWHTGWWSHY